MRYNVREEILALTPEWKGERFADGRPKVPDYYLEALRGMTLEEIWKPLFVKGYDNQFEGKLKRLHDDERKLIGRAVTAAFVPVIRFGFEPFVFVRRLVRRFRWLRFHRRPIVFG